MQAAQVQSLVRDDPTCRMAKPNKPGDGDVATGMVFKITWLEEDGKDEKKVAMGRVRRMLQSR